MELEKNVESDEFMPEVYQQFLCYQKKVNKRFQEMEGMLGLAAQQLEKLKVRKAKRKNTKFDNPIVKSKVESSKEVEPEPLHHLKLRFPKFEGAEVFECSQDYEHQLVGCGIGNMAKEWPNHTKEPHNRQQKREVFKNLAHAASETYTGKPIYDERPVYDEPGEGQDCWPEHEFILAALRGDNSNSPHLLQSGLCTSKSSEEIKTPMRFLVPETEDQAYKIVRNCASYVKLEKRSTVLVPEVSQFMMTTEAQTPSIKVTVSNQVQVAKGKNQQCETQILLDKGSEELRELSNERIVHDLKPMLTFDPGGFVQHIHSPCVTKMFKGIKRHEVTHDEAAKLISASGEATRAPGHADRAYNALILDVQQRFLKNRETTSSRLQQIEDMLEPAVPILCLIKQANAVGYELEQEFTNPIGGKDNEEMPSMATSIQEGHNSLKHLKLRSPVLQRNTGVRTWLEDYQESPRLIKDLSRFPELKLGALINLACGQSEEWQEYLEFVVQMEHVARAQGRQEKIGRLVRQGDHEASEKSVTIYVFDPGGMRLSNEDQP